jgi:DNA polymerase III subunit alpha
VVKIVSKKLVGIEKVYDIGVERDHNFILENGLVASNCFNKSHSTAYAYVTYQTAYLKANYPVEYMAALLTANSGDQDKVQKYITNCQNMKISVEGPDINRSEIHFTPDDGKILFGLSAIKNVGEGAIECILKVRRQNGNFTSLEDLCDRVDLRAVNSRALEALVKSGAFDKISPNRKQLVEYLPSVISWVQKSKEVDNQPTLFDLAAVRTPAPKLPEVKDFAPQEKLLCEKELLGFYVSDHPLKFMEKVAQNLGLEIINLSQLEEQKSKAKISVGAMLVEIKQVVTKKGDSMAILQLEDLSGRASAVVFPKTYETVKEFLTADQPSIITGKVDKQDDRLQIIVEEIKILTREQLAAAESITPVADDDEESSEDLETHYLVVLQLTPQWAQNENLMRQLQAVLKEQSGAIANVPVMAIVADDRQQTAVRFGKEFWVQNYQAAMEAIKNAGFSAYIQTKN